jgi:hypothetical protein
MLRELAERKRDGLTVRLAWDDEQDVIVLSIDDHGRTGSGEIPHDRALDAFHHPFVYVTLDEAPEQEAPPVRESNLHPLSELERRKLEGYDDDGVAA